MKQKIIIIITGIIAGILIVTIALQIPNSAVRTSTEIPTAIPSSIPISSIPAKVPYNSNAVNKMMNIVNKRPALSDTDKTAKQALISGISNPDGETVYANSEFRVLYIRGLDLFQVEILSTNIQQAKTDAVNWLEASGISAQGVCNIPVTFYMNENVLNQLQGQNTQFSPIPDSCQ